MPQKESHDGTTQVRKITPVDKTSPRAASIQRNREDMLPTWNALARD